jgi:hypothetical protein
MVDFNVPGARTLEKCADLCQGMYIINSINPGKNACAAVLPDLPKQSSKRGLADEVDMIQKSCWSLKLHCDTRYIECFDLPDARSEVNSCKRRFSDGRIIVNHSAVEDNPWLNSSELSLAGRSLGGESVCLPRQKDLILPESTDASSDLKVGARQRPSPEQVAAQKGTNRYSSKLTALLSGVF